MIIGPIGVAAGIFLAYQKRHGVALVEVMKVSTTKGESSTTTQELKEKEKY